MLKTVGNPSTRFGDQTIVAGNQIIGTAGKGVDFSANPSAPGMTSELLDWYEEGTFTPVLVGSTTAGTASYGRQTGRYTRVGNLVTFSIDLDWSGGTGAGDMRIGGLPYASASGHNTGVGSSYSNFATTALNIPQPWIAGGSTQVLMFQVPVGGGSVTAVAYPSTGAAMLFGSYTV